MKKQVIQYRSMNDFCFGCFTVRTGSAWMDIYGRLKKTGKQTLMMRIVFENGKGSNEWRMLLSESSE